MRLLSPRILFFFSLLAFVNIQCEGKKTPPPATPARSYYIDETIGNDAADGLSASSSWKTLGRAEQEKLQPGDSLRFKRGASFTGPLYINYSGTARQPIVVTDYGDAAQPAPSFTNPVFTRGNFGNCVRIKGDYVIVENLYFHSTSSYVRGDYTAPQGQWDTTVWEMGAVYIDKGAEHCVVRNNEFKDCVVGIKSYGQYALMENNYLHDCNRVLKEWGWGPLGIWFGADYQEARYNRIFNYRAEDPRINWGDTTGGADGGAFEIDDARYAKSNISIHHNYTRDCQGFLEVTWTDILQNPAYSQFRVHHNISDDYQQFIALWNGVDCYFENNTIIRRKKNVNDWGVFNITQTNARNKISNNIIVVEKDIQVFNTGLQDPRFPRNIIQNNLYYAASGSLVMGYEGPGEGAVYGDPLFVNYGNGNKPEDFSIRAGSPAIDKGIKTGYGTDFAGTGIPKGNATDIGAFEWRE